MSTYIQLKYNTHSPASITSCYCASVIYSSIIHLLNELIVADVKLCRPYQSVICQTSEWDSWKNTNCDICMYWCTQQQQRQRSCLHILKIAVAVAAAERESTIHAHIVAIQLEPTRNCCLLPIYHQRDTLNVIIVVCTALIENKKGEEDEAERKRWWHTTKTITKTPISITF